MKRGINFRVIIFCFVFLLLIANLCKGDKEISKESEEIFSQIQTMIAGGEIANPGYSDSELMSMIEQDIAMTNSNPVMLFASRIAGSESRTCSSIWGGDCGEGPAESFDNTYDSCNYGQGNNESINEIYVNESMLLYEQEIEVKCNVLLKHLQRDYALICSCDRPILHLLCRQGDFYIYYRNSSAGIWTRKYFTTPVTTCENYSVSFVPDQVEGEHQVRCVLGKDTMPEEECGSGGSFDNDDANFSVYSEFISITITNSPIDFGEVDMNTTKNATNNPLMITIDSNVNFDITTSASDFSDGTGNIFSVSNMAWALSEVGAKTPYTTSEATVYSNQEPGNFPVYHSLFIPVGQRAGTYNSNVVITAKKSE